MQKTHKLLTLAVLVMEILKYMLSVKIAFKNIFIKMVLLFVLSNYVMFCTV